MLHAAFAEARCAIEQMLMRVYDCLTFAATLRRFSCYADAFFFRCHIAAYAATPSAAAAAACFDEMPACRMPPLLRRR